MRKTPTTELNGPAVRKRAIILMRRAILTFLAGSVAMVKIHDGFGWVAFGIIVGCNILAARLRCPRCGNPIYRNEIRLFGVTWDV